MTSHFLFEFLCGIKETTKRHSSKCATMNIVGVIEELARTVIQPLWVVIKKISFPKYLHYQVYASGGVWCRVVSNKKISIGAMISGYSRDAGEKGSRQSGHQGSLSP